MDQATLLTLDDDVLAQMLQGSFSSSLEPRMVATDSATEAAQDVLNGVDDHFNVSTEDIDELDVGDLPDIPEQTQIPNQVVFQPELRQDVHNSDNVRIGTTTDLLDMSSSGFVMHNNVQITHPTFTTNFFSSEKIAFDETLMTDDEVDKSFRNVDFDMSQKGHAPARAACHTMKMLRAISMMHNIPLRQLLWECGSMESHKCQALVAKKGKGETQCGSACIAGEFFCASHKKKNDDVDGLVAFVEKRKKARTN